MYVFFVVSAILLSSTLLVADENSELQKSITTALISATKDADDGVRIAAFSALSDQPRSVEVVSAFRHGLEDGNTNVRLLALSKLVDYEEAMDEVMDQLIAAIGKPEVAPQLAGGARKLLIKIGAPAAPRLMKSLKSDKTKLSAIDILGRIHLGKFRSEAVTNLTKLLKDEDPKVRIAVIGALKKLATTQIRAADARYAKYVKYAVGYITRYDTNKDGVLTVDEWRKMRDDPGSADQNKDGRITPMEMARYMMER